MALDVSSIEVESFDTSDTLAISASDWKCTGCDSGCGIIPDP
jgi:hypothetical protein